MEDFYDVSKLDNKSKSYYDLIEKGYKVYLEQNKINLNEEDFKKNVNVLFLADTVDDISVQAFVKSIEYAKLNGVEDYLKIMLNGSGYNYDTGMVDIIKFRCYEKSL